MSGHTRPGLVYSAGLCIGCCLSRVSESIIIWVISCQICYLLLAATSCSHSQPTTVCLASQRPHSSQPGSGQPLTANLHCLLAFSLFLQLDTALQLACCAFTSLLTQQLILSALNIISCLTSGFFVPVGAKPGGSQSNSHEHRSQTPAPASFTLLHAAHEPQEAQTAKAVQYSLLCIQACLAWRLMS